MCVWVGSILFICVLCVCVVGVRVFELFIAFVFRIFKFLIVFFCSVVLLGFLHNRKFETLKTKSNKKLNFSSFCAFSEDFSLSDYFVVFSSDKYHSE